MEETNINQTIRCIVKLGLLSLKVPNFNMSFATSSFFFFFFGFKTGGAAITCKNELEKINEENLETVSSHLRQAMNLGSCSKQVMGMDWSKRDGVSDISSSLCDFGAQCQFNVDFSRFVVVHGAGSFGHFQASKSGVHKGGLNQPLVKAEGIPSIGMSPYSCGWSTSERNGCTILSGDVIIRHLAEHLRPEYVIFLVSFSRLVNSIDLLLHAPKIGLFTLHCRCLTLFHACFPIIVIYKTDVSGVYDRPPTDPNAVLLREIAVDEDGKWSVVKPTPQSMNKQVEITVAAHDTTGGMVTKISEAAMIAKLGIDVYIVKAATSHSLRALRGELRHDIPDDWLGTVIRFSR
ncbi:glutamate 5-kinase [Gossypium australe]|uniref:Glutamate 5-kinase n=1 Tax=Gossypium australe TaxID=47621 RepID=A0A5B6X4G9_9ROSI|nr:glutamate 5-kinase [Gossypium australe]